MNELKRLLLKTMNKARNQFLYELVGSIREKKLKKLKDRSYFNLTVTIPNQPQLTCLQAFQNKLTNPQIWED